MAWRARREGVSFLVPDLEGRGRAHLKGAHCERLEVSIAFPGIPSETSRVSETPLFELLNEEDPELLQNHYGESSVVGSLFVSAGATLVGLSWTLPVPSTLSLRLIESSSPAVSSSVFYLEFPL